MFGVVLWADPVDRKAVIWCEDHGDLAYFKGSLHEGGFPRSIPVIWCNSSCSVSEACVWR